MSALKVIFGFVAVFYLLICTAMFFFQRKLQYFPISASVDDSEKIGLADLIYRDGVEERLLGHYSARSDDPARVVLVFHGNGGNALGRIWLLEVFAKYGLNESTATVFAEYSGYGVRSEDEPPTEKNIIADALTTFDLARSKWPNAQIVVLGESLGTGVAVAVSAERKVDKLLLISPFSSAADVAAGAYPWLPVRMLMLDRFDSMSIVKDVNAPLQIIHGSVDRVVPIQLGQRLFDAYPGAKAFKVLPGVDHNDMAMNLINGKDEGVLAAFISN